MKKILFGVCSIGQGHLNRQKLIIEHMLKKGIKVVIVTSGDESFLKNNFTNIKILKCSVPWIVTNNNGLDFVSSLNCYRNNKKDFFEEFLEMSMQIEKEFNGIPDMVISDYEPNVAQYAYSRNIPLINLEQQSKFLLYKNDMMKNNISIREETSRLNYFFPKSDLKIISSFFPIDCKKVKNVVNIPPIINKLNENHTMDNFILVYFSTYGGENSRKLFEKILNMIVKIDNYKFKIYSNLKFEIYNNKNIEFCEFSNKFKEDLMNCSFVISTSGHQLISECILYEKPMLLTAFNTFEQNFNLSMVNKYILGMKIHDFDKSDFIEFVNNREIYVKNIKNFKRKYWKKSWEQYFEDIFRKIDKCCKK